MTSAITTMAGSEAAEATADVLGIKSLLLARDVIAGKTGKTATAVLCTATYAKGAKKPATRA